MEKKRTKQTASCRQQKDNYGPSRHLVVECRYLLVHVEIYEDINPIIFIRVNFLECAFLKSCEVLLYILLHFVDTFMNRIFKIHKERKIQVQLAVLKICQTINLFHITFQLLGELFSLYNKIIHIFFFIFP